MLDPVLMTNLPQSWSYMAGVWSRVLLRDRFIDRQYPVRFHYQCYISRLDLLIACQIRYCRLIDLSIKKSMTSATRYVSIGYLADGLSLHVYNMLWWFLCDCLRQLLSRRKTRIQDKSAMHTRLSLLLPTTTSYKAGGLSSLQRPTCASCWEKRGNQVMIISWI